MLKISLSLGAVSILALFVFGFFVSPAFAKGNPHGMPQQANANGNSHQIVTLDEPDEGDNEHPSGKDRSVEPGKSGTQGNSSSDPDDDGRGPDRTNNGPDKQPDGAGGVDRDDQDNNNGCGNDDDFEDDNEGWCGKNPKGGPKNGNGNGDNGDNGNGGGNGNGNGNEGNGKVNGEDFEEGEVLGAQDLPITGPIGGMNPLSVSAILVFAGAVLRIASRRFESLFVS
jgi:hypothetical protein